MFSSLGYLCKDKSDIGVRKLLVDGSIPLDRLLVETDAPFMYPNTRASKLPLHVKDGLTERFVFLIIKMSRRCYHVFVMAANLLSITLNSVFNFDVFWT